MRSLKKALSLVLVLALMLSVCIFSASASNFADDDDIQYKEAVDVLTAIKVIDGMGDNTFNPKGTLTRAQAAKIVSYILLSADTNKLATSGSSFVDVLGTADEWASPYIEYCVNAKVIGGYGNGCFGPSDPLTGFAFAKMLLCALGYDADIEGYTGATWTIGVASDIIDAGLDEGLPGGFNYNAPLTREEACQIAFNALKANMVEYSTKGTTINTSDGTTVVTGASLATPKYDRKGASYASNIDNEEFMDGVIIQLGEYYFQDLKLTEAGKADDFGRPANTWKLKTTEIGTYADTGDLIATYDGKVTLGTLYSLIGKNDIKDIKNGAGESSLAVYVDGVPLYDEEDVDLIFDSGNSGTFAGLWTDENHAMGIDATGAGSYTEVYQTKDNKVTIVVINEYLVQATANYSSSKDELKVELKTEFEGLILSDTTLSGDDFDLSGYQQDDYIVVTLAYDDGEDKFEVKSTTPAKMVEGVVDSINKNTNKVEFGSVTIDGTAYKYALNAPVDDGYAAGYGVKEKAIVVTDKNGYILFVDDAIAVDKYLFVYDFGGEDMVRGSKKADVFFLDGTDAVVTLDTVKDKDGNKIATSEIADEDSGWFSYSTGSDGKYTLKRIPTTDVEFTNEGDVVLVNGQTKFIGKGDSLVNKAGNSKTVIVVNDDKEDDTTVYNGATKAPDLKLGSGGSATVFYTHKDNDESKAIEYVFVMMTGAGSVDDGNATSNDYTYLLWTDGVGTDPDDNEFTQIEVLKNGEWAMESLKGSDGQGPYFQLVYKVKTNSDGYITGWTTIEDAITENDKGDDFYFAEIEEAGVLNVTKGTLDWGDESIDVSSADIYLIIAKDFMDGSTDKLMADAGNPADFTNVHISGSTLKSILSGYKVTGDLTGIRASDNSDSMKTLYVTILGAEEIAANGE